MNLKAPLLETAQELFATLTRINPQLEVRKRYDILRSILNIAVEQQLTDVTIKLSMLKLTISLKSTRSVKTTAVFHLP